MKKFFLQIVLLIISVSAFGQSNYFTYNPHPSFLGDPIGMKMSANGKIFTEFLYDHDEIFQRFDSATGLNDGSFITEHRYSGPFDANEFSNNCYVLVSKNQDIKLQYSSGNNQYQSYQFGVPLPSTFFSYTSFIKIYNSQYLLIFFNGYFTSTNYYGCIYKYDMITNHIVDTSQIIYDAIFKNCSFDNLGNVYVCYDSKNDKKTGVVKFSESNLSLLWNKKITHNNFYDQANIISVSPNNSTVILSGYSDDSLVTYLQISSKVLFVRMTSSGVIKKTTTLLTKPGAKYNLVNSLKIDSLSNIVIAGAYTDSFSSHHYSMIGKYNKNGLPLWRKFGIKNSFWSGSDFDQQGNLYAVGNYVVNDSLIGSEQVWVKKLNYQTGATISSQKSPLQPIHFYDRLRNFILNGDAIYCVGSNINGFINPYYDPVLLDLQSSFIK